jgi:hypothetical protein
MGASISACVTRGRVNASFDRPRSSVGCAYDNYKFNGCVAATFRLGCISQLVRNTPLDSNHRLPVEEYSSITTITLYGTAVQWSYKRIFGLIVGRPMKCIDYIGPPELMYTYPDVV